MSMLEADNVVEERRNQLTTSQAEFQEIFGVRLTRFWHPIFGFDIVKFDDNFIRPPDGTSTHEAIVAKYGERAAELVESLF